MNERNYQYKSRPNPSAKRRRNCNFITILGNNITFSASSGDLTLPLKDVCWIRVQPRSKVYPDNMDFVLITIEFKLNKTIKQGIYTEESIWNWRELIQILQDNAVKVNIVK